MAAAVSAAVMLPVGAQADVTVYGRINNALVFEDMGAPGADSTTDMRTIASRFGVKASSDLGNGLTAHGRYEFATTTAEEAAGIVDTRIATVGISGGFGRVDLGNQWSAFYNSVGVDIDPTYWVAGIGGTPYRSSNTIKYSNSVGPLALQADLRLNDGRDNADAAEGLRGNGGGIGLRVSATDNITLAAAFDTEDQSDETGGSETDRMAVSGHVSLGRFFGKLAWSHEDDGTETDYMQLWIGGNLMENTSAIFGYGREDEDGSDANPTAVTLGLYHNMGGGLRLWYEGISKDSDVAGTDNHIQHYFGVRYDF